VKNCTWGITIMTIVIMFATVLGMVHSHWAGGEMDFWEFLARSEGPAVVVTVILLLRRPLTRMVDEVALKAIDLGGAKVEFDKRLSAVEALMKEREKLAADPEFRAAAWRGAQQQVREAWQGLERHASGELSEEDAQALKRLQEWKDEFLNRRTSFSFDEVSQFREDAEQLMMRMRSPGISSTFWQLDQPSPRWPSTPAAPAVKRPWIGAAGGRVFAKWPPGCPLRRG
jgi:hypothetical protein